MKIQRCVLLWPVFLLLMLFGACQHPVKTKEPNLLSYFPPFTPGDTLHVEIATEIDEASGTIIPSPIFFKQVPAALLERVSYLDDSTEALVYGRQQFPIDNNTTACWVEVRQFWFQHQALLLYDKRKKVITDMITLAEWYGGDGGQILTGSWLFDYDGDGKKDLVRREIEHHTEINGEEWTEHINQSASLLLWKNGKFMETSLIDTTALIKHYPIRSFW